MAAGEVDGEELGLVHYHGLCGGCEVVSPGSIVFNVLYNERVARKGGLFCEARWKKLLNLLDFLRFLRLCL